MQQNHIWKFQTQCARTLFVHWTWAWCSWVRRKSLQKIQTQVEEAFITRDNTRCNSNVSWTKCIRKCIIPSGNMLAWFLGYGIYLRVSGSCYRNARDSRKQMPLKHNHGFHTHTSKHVCEEVSGKKLVLGRRDFPLPIRWRQLGQVNPSDLWRSTDQRGK